MGPPEVGATALVLCATAVERKASTLGRVHIARRRAAKARPPGERRGRVRPLSKLQRLEVIEAADSAAAGRGAHLSHRHCWIEAGSMQTWMLVSN